MARTLAALASLTLGGGTAVTATAVTATAAAATTATAATASAASVANPTHNSTPRPATVNACLRPRASIRACDAHALLDIDAARRGEGIAPIALPGDFESLSVPERLLALANLERVDRGLPAVAGLTRRLDGAATAAAAAETDPSGPSGYSWGSNWAGGTRSTVFDDFSWMYDDGFGSQNLACRTPGDSGCWGHRDNVLAAFEAPVAMGAGAHAASLAELLVADYRPAATGQDPLLAPTWQEISQTLPVGLSRRAIRLGRGARSAQLRLWASGEAMSVTAAIAPAGSAWNVSPSGCQLAAGSSCTLRVARPRPAGSGRASLVLSGPNGRQTVALF